VALRGWLWVFGPSAMVAGFVACASIDGLAGGSPDADAGDGATLAEAAPDGASIDASADGEAGCQIPTADPSFLSDAIEIDTNGAHVCAVRLNGDVVCWGDNARAQLGIATTDAGSLGIDMSTRPLRVAGIPKASHVAAGYAHACALVTSGEVWCWGEGAKGQTGNDGAQAPPGLSQVPTEFGLPLANVIALTAGAAFTCALTQGGGVQCWGDNGLGQLGSRLVPQSQTPVPVAGLGVSTMVTAGFFHACAFGNGAVRCWGGDLTSELGIPLPDGGSSPPIAYDVTGPARVTASSPDTCVLDAKANVICSGYNSDGQLGTTSKGNNINVPFPIPELSSGDVRDIDIGMAHTCGIRTNGTAFCLGGLSLEALGRGPIDASTIDNAARPVLGPGTGSALLSPVDSLKVGGKDYGGGGHTCAIVKPACAPAGQVYCWGSNQRGVLGDGTTTPRDRPVKVLAPL
jgi:alpha-tubulin suppressor-like RCC1 family protein